MTSLIFILSLLLLFNLSLAQQHQLPPLVATDPRPDQKPWHPRPAWVPRDVQEAQQVTPTCQNEVPLFTDPGDANTANLYNQTQNWNLIDFNMSYPDNFSISKSWFVNAAPLNTSAYLITNPITLPHDSTQSFFFSFWHKYNMERGYDGCMVYYTIDNQQTWNDMGHLFTENGYNFQMFSQRGSIPAFTGDAETFGQTVADLSTLRGKNISIAFIALTDFSLPSVGWWVNRIKLWSAECDRTDQTPTHPPPPSQTRMDPSPSSQTQAQQPTPSHPSSGQESSKTESSNAASVAALAISILTAVFVFVMSVLGCRSYYRWKNAKALRKEVPMVSIATHEVTPPSPSPIPRS